MMKSRLAILMTVVTAAAGGALVYFGQTPSDPEETEDKEREVKPIPRSLIGRSVSAAPEPPAASAEGVRVDIGDPSEDSIAEATWRADLQAYLQGDLNALDRFLALVTPENWKEAGVAVGRAITRSGDSRLASELRQRFYRRLGDFGSETIARELMSQGEAGLGIVLEGWGETDPQSLFDFFAGLDLSEDPQIRNYLEQAELDLLFLTDQFSGSILDGIFHEVPAGEIGMADADHVGDMVDFFLEKDPIKAESMMREFAERIIGSHDAAGLKEWVSSMEDPVVQAASLQRVIEGGKFDENFGEALVFAWSLEEPRPRRVALSALYARLANGQDRKVTADRLESMPSSAEKDFAINGFSHGLVASDPDAAIEWARTIGNESFRQVVVENVSKRINRRAANAAE